MGSFLAEMIRRHATERPDRPCLTYQDRTTTFGQLHERSSRVAQGLMAEGLGPQARVAFLDKNCPEYLDVLFGGAKANVVNVAVNWRLAPPEMAHIINDAEARVLFVGPELRSHVDQIRDDLHTVKTVIELGEPFESWLRAFEPDDPELPVADHDVCCQLYTSGTTGLPKGAMLTNANFDCLVPQVSPHWRFSEDSVNLVVMPLFHIGGSGWLVIGLWNGCHSVMLREVNPAEILAAVPRHEVTNALFVPAVLQFLLQTPGVDETDFSTLRTIVYGASPITHQVLTDAMRTFGCEFIQVYGLTETTGAFTELPDADHDPAGPHPERLRSCGKPFPWVEARVVDPEAGEDKPAGEVGEVWVRSAQNMKGYWGKPEETAKTVNADGWLRTGDAAYFDDDGYLYLYDRVKDMIISGGENVYPAEVENVLMSHPGVADVGVVGVPDPRWGETVKACVVRAPGTEASEQEIIEYARQRVAHYKCPTSVDFFEALPRNLSGKILKRELREPYWRGHERLVH